MKSLKTKTWVLLLIVAALVVYFTYLYFKPFYTGPVSNHFDGSRFKNPSYRHKNKTWQFLKWQATRNAAKWPLRNHITPNTDLSAHVEGNRLLVTFVGHSTVLIQTQGINILTDPIWSQRASPFQWIGPKRVSQPGIPFASLPKVDVVLISHTHYDHLDINTINKLNQRDKPLFLMGLGVMQQVKSQLHAPINTKALDWRQSVTIKNNVKISFIPILHWSARGIFDNNKTLWGGYVIQTQMGNILFAGDTGYQKRIYKAIKEHYSPIRLAILPIGAFLPRWFMRYNHMDPYEAVQAYKTLKASYALGIHYGTFQLSDEAIDEPEKQLKIALKKSKINKNTFRALNIGQTWAVPVMNQSHISHGCMGDD